MPPLDPDNSLQCSLKECVKFKILKSKQRKHTGLKQHLTRECHFPVIRLLLDQVDYILDFISWSMCFLVLLLIAAILFLGAFY